MAMIIMFYDQTLILKLYIKNHDRQTFNYSTNFLIYLIFRTLTLFTTLARHSLNSQIHLCISAKHKTAIEPLEPTLIYDH